KLQEEVLSCSREQLELVSEGLDAAGSEEFTAGLRQLLSSQQAAREHRRRKTASRRVHLELPSPAWEGMDSEERRHFTAFMEQLGMDISEGQEIWQLWENLQKDEPQLLGNLEDFLAKMKHHIQEARSKKEALEVTLSKYKAEHDQELQQQQMQQDQQPLEQQSMARSPQHGMEQQPVLNGSERELQMQLETQCHRLHSMNQATSPERQQLEEELQAQQTHRHLQITRS
ncbi:RAB44 protein, partial [Bucco capensis]|nr:RAB44 protein [Bucco capensis]